MKKLLTALLSAALLLCLPVAAFAADAEPPTDTAPPGTEQLTTDPPDTEPPTTEQPDTDSDNGTEPPEAGPAPIYTAAELQAAVAAASDGDTIAVSSTILLDGVTLATDKGLTLTTASDFCNSNLVELQNGAMISGFSFACDGERTTAVYIGNSSTAATVRNCSFSCPVAVYVAGNADGEPTAAYIEGCTFANAESSAVCVREYASVTVESCTFTHNTATMQGGAVNNGGVLSISNSTITDNRAASGGGIFNSGTLTLANTVICSNTSTNAVGADIFNLGTLALTDEPTEGKGFYEEITGEKIALPLPACSDTAKLVFLTDEEAAQRFAPPVTDPPQESNEQDPTTDTTPPDTTQQPTTTPPTTTTGPTYTPPISHTTSTTNPKRQETTQREETAHNTETATKEKNPPLVCGKAVIDMSRSVVLCGYDDGLLHLEDSLTRGQMATIIYRLLDEDTLALYNTTESVFSDVPNGLWCCGYISTIAKAGIVAGTGNGCFAPSGKLTWAQIITVMARFVEPASCTLQNITYNGWAVEAVQTAVALGWIEDSATFNPNAIISRGEFMDFVNGVLALYHAV